MGISGKVRRWHHSRPCPVWSHAVPILVPSLSRPRHRTRLGAAGHGALVSVETVPALPGSERSFKNANLTRPLTCPQVSGPSHPVSSIEESQPGAEAGAGEQRNRHSRLGYTPPHRTGRQSTPTPRHKDGSEYVNRRERTDPHGRTPDPSEGAGAPRRGGSSVTPPKRTVWAGGQSGCRQEPTSTVQPSVRPTSATATRQHVP